LVLGFNTFPGGHTFVFGGDFLTDFLGLPLFFLGVYTVLDGKVKVLDTLGDCGATISLNSPTGVGFLVFLEVLALLHRLVLGFNTFPGGHFLGDFLGDGGDIRLDLS